MAASEMTTYEDRARGIRELIADASGLLSAAKTLADRYYAAITCLKVINKLLFSFHLSDHLIAVGERMMVEIVAMKPTSKRINDMARRIRGVLLELDETLR